MEEMSATGGVSVEQAEKAVKEMIEGCGLEATTVKKKDPIEVVGLDRRIDELSEELRSAHTRDIGRVVSRHMKALAAELQPPRVSEETIEAAVTDLWDAIVEGRYRKPSLTKLLRDYFQPKPRVWPMGDPYPEDWVRVEEWVPTHTSYIQIKCGEGYESSGWYSDNRSKWYITVPGTHNDAEVDATHWRRRP